MSEATVNARAWRALAAALMLALTVPRLWQQGMFIDGITYAVVARNLAMGVGSLWTPSFSTTIYPEFHEQPPLGMAIESVAFRLFGDHFAVERAYSLAIFALNGLLVAAIWRRLLPRAYDWLPVIIWMVPSVVTWAVINNMLENTQAVFTNLACYSLLLTATASRARSVLLAMVAGASVVAAVLVKGPVGLFPLAMPALMLLLPASERPRSPIALWSVFFAFVMVAAVGLAAADGPRNAIDGFVSSHLAPALGGERGIGLLGWDFSRHLALGIWLRMAVVAAIVWIVWRLRRGGAVPVVPVRQAAFLFATALAASLPILVSPVLAGHYFVPSMPLFALAFASLTAPAVAGFRSTPGSLSWRIPVLLTGLLLVAIPAVLIAHGPMEVRNRELVRDLNAVHHVAPAGATIGACPATRDDWGLLNYLQRFYRISLRPDGVPESGWFLLAGGCQGPPACRSVANTTEFTLLRCDR